MTSPANKCAAFFKKVLSFLLLVLTASAGAVFGKQIFEKLFPEPAEKTHELVISKSAAELQTEFADVIRRAAPALVHIEPEDGADGKAWNRFGNSLDSEKLHSGSGSGFLITKDGCIVTLARIVRGRKNFRITMLHGKKYSAHFAGADPATDIALLKIDGRQDFPVLHFADMEETRLGHWVLAAGALTDGSPEAVSGIVSALPSGGKSEKTLENLVQTNAALHPGNSGGPLLNIRGQVLGVSDFYLSPEAGKLGVHFAVSAGLVRKIAEDLIRQGEIARPMLGISARSLTGEERTLEHLASGILICEVASPSPAEDSLEKGDILLAAGGTPLDSPRELLEQILRAGKNGEVELEIRRGNRTVKGSLQLRKAPKNWFQDLNNENLALPQAL